MASAGLYKLLVHPPSRAQTEADEDSDQRRHRSVQGQLSHGRSTRSQLRDKRVTDPLA